MNETEQIQEIIEELELRSGHEVFQYIPGELPNWNQRAFHESTARYRMAFGGNRSGKSYAAAYEIACWLRGDHPYRKINLTPNSVWVISPEYTTIQAGIYNHLKNLLPTWEIEKVGPKIPQQNLPSYIEMKNGSVVTFKSAKGDSSAREKFQAASVDLISIDEEVQVDIWLELEMRTLDRGGQYIFSATLVESYDWLVDLEQRALRGEEDYFLTRLYTETNPHLHEETVKKVKDKLSEDDIEVRFKGKSRRSRGLIYNTFTDDHIIEPFPIPIDWPRWCALDPGIRTFAVLWVAIGPEGAYVYREMYAHNVPLWEMALAIRRAEGWKYDEILSDSFSHYVWTETKTSEFIQSRLIDPAETRRSITGDASIVDQLFDKYGLMCVTADNSMRPGIEACRHWLEHDFAVFRTCESFIGEIRRYRIREPKLGRMQNDPVESPVKKEDHLMDCWRYIAMDNPQFTIVKKPEEEANTAFRRGHAPVRKPREKLLVHGILGTEW